MNALQGHRSSGKAAGWIIALVVVALIVAVPVMYYISTYNTLVKLDEGVKSAWGNVETTYQRRMDLIPNLVSTVKGYADFEKSTLTAVIEARAKATQTVIKADQVTNPEQFQKFQQAQGELTSALSRLMVVVERYPELKANNSFLKLQDELSGTENRIAVARKRFNDAARDYNTTRRGFFARMVADWSGFGEAQYFKAEERAATAPAVKFD